MEVKKDSGCYLIDTIYISSKVNLKKGNRVYIYIYIYIGLGGRNFNGECETQVFEVNLQLWRRCHYPIPQFKGYPTEISPTGNILSVF